MGVLTLTDRYIDAAMRTVPERQRADLGAELRASIQDQVDARVEAGEPRDAAERAVLTELGDPDKLAAGYTDRPLHLVGPRYFLDWWRLLRLLLWIVPPCVAFGVALGQTLAGEPVGSIIGTTIAATLAAVLHVAFWTTLVFAVLERTGHETVDAGPWTPDRLPEPKERGAGLGDLVASLVFLFAAAGAIVWDHVLGLVFLGGEWMPFLDPGLWPWWIGGLFVAMGLEALLAIGVYARRRWTWELATANSVLALVVAVPALGLLWNGRLVNPGVLAALEAAGADLGEAVPVLAVVTGFAIAGIAIWDSIDGFLKAFRAR